MKYSELRYLLIKTNDTKTILPKEPTLEELQNYVGGYIEKCNVPGGYMWINEDGRLKNLPVNRFASALYNDLIVGDIVYVVKVNYLNGGSN